MEEMKVSITTLTGAVNQLLQQVKLIETRLCKIEQGNNMAELSRRLEQIERQEHSNSDSIEVVASTLQVPRTEEDLKSICRLPDSVKELRTFDGNPLQYVSWVHSVEMVLKDFEIVRDKPIYRSIIQSIRQKVVGEADAALVSYNVFEADWTEIKKILSLHYADKRDVQTLEHQLNQLSQGSSKVDEFYSTVNHQLSLIINKLKTESYSEETINALIATHRNRALDIFIRGLTPELSRMVIIQRPKTLPEAYSACLELQNLTMRNNILHPKVNVRINTQQPIQNRAAVPPRPPKPYLNNNRASNFRHNVWQDRNSGYQHHNFNPNYRPSPFPRQQQIKPEPMEVDRSIQTRRINYINRPKPAEKRSASEMYNKDKQARLFHLDLDQSDVDNTPQEEVGNTLDDSVGEQNFMEEGHQVFLT